MFFQTAQAAIWELAAVGCLTTPQEVHCIQCGCGVCDGKNDLLEGLLFTCICLKCFLVRLMFGVFDVYVLWISCVRLTVKDADITPLGQIAIVTALDS